MGRTARDNRDLPHPKPVQKIQLSEDNTKRRLIATVLFLIIGVAALAYAVSGLLTPDSGWQTIYATGAGATCADQFTLIYELGSSELPMLQENRAITMLYSDGCRKAFQLFQTQESFEGVTNLRDINLHPNETLTVDEGLYRAFEVVQRSGDRTVYLGPVYDRYDSIFNCQDDSQLVDFDPWTSYEVAQEYAAYAAYAQDPQAVDLQLLGEGRVRLYVSEEYLTFARREGVTCFLDFGWLENAFIADYLADLLAAEGFTHGSISSCDGFSRNIDSREVTYALNIHDRVDGKVYPAAAMEYNGPLSIAYLHSYPMDELDGQRFYQLRDGQLRSDYLDPADGRCRSAANDLVCYSKMASCAEIALQMAPIYVADGLDTAALDVLAGQGVYAVYCRDRVVYGNEPGIVLTGLYQSDSVSYRQSTLGESN